MPYCITLYTPNSIASFRTVLTYRTVLTVSNSTVPYRRELITYRTASLLTELLPPNSISPSLANRLSCTISQQPCHVSPYCKLRIVSCHTVAYIAYLTFFFQNTVPIVLFRTVTYHGTWCHTVFEQKQSYTNMYLNMFIFLKLPIMLGSIRHHFVDIGLFYKSFNNY